MPADFLRGVTRREWFGVAAASLVLAAGLALPYGLAYRAPGDLVFSGTLINRADGQSYLAKMQAGWRGEWLFTLPYTAEPGPGVLFYTYYLFLGHLARWTGAGVEPVYHAARVLAGVCLLLSGYHFIARFFGTVRARFGVWLLFALGSGLGWLAVPFNAFTSDLWVAEAFPFLAAFINSHFCLTIALMLWVCEWTLPGLADFRSNRHLILTAPAVTLIAQTQPLALIVLGGIIGAAALCGALAQRRFILREWLPLIVAAACALPWLVYDGALVLTNPHLAGWTAQNLTPSPPWWDALLSGGLPLLLAGPGVLAALRRRSALDLIPVIWLGVAVAGLLAPFSLQRRLAFGVWMPITLLAGVGLREWLWPRLARPWRAVALGLIGLFALPTNVLVYGATLGAIQQGDPQLFLTRAEAEAMGWLKAHGRREAVVLAGPDTGLYIPARTGLRVLYGHPFETVNAQAEREAVEGFFRGEKDPAQFLPARRIEFIFYGPRERLLGPLPELPAGWRAVFAVGGVTVYGR